MKKVSAVFLILILSAVTAVFVFGLQQSAKRVTPSDGRVDLTSADVLESPVSIDASGFSYYPDRLYGPEDFARGVPTAPVPFAQDNLLHTRYGTYRLRLHLPAGKTYALSAASINYSQRTFINGAEQTPVGTVDASRDSAAPATNQCFFVFTPQTDETEIVMQYANFDHREGGEAYPLLLGSVQAVENFYGRSIFFTSILAGASLMIGIFYTGLFFIYKQERCFLFFAVCLYAAALRTPAFLLFRPDTSWYVLMDILYLSLIVIIAFFVAYLDALLPRLLHKAGKIYLYAVCAAYAALVLFTQPAIYTRALPFFHIATVIYEVYIIFRLLTHLKEYREEGVCIVTGSLCAVLFMAADIVYYTHMESYLNVSATQAGLFIFIVGNILALMFRFSKTQRQLLESQQRERELALQNEQYDRLNALRSSFMQNVVHELKTPLTIMSGFAQLSSQKVEADMDKKDILNDLDTIAEESERLSALVSRLLDLSVEGNQDDCQQTKITGLISKAASLYRPAAERKGIALKESTEPDLPDIFLQPARILQVLLNLLSNAVRHTDAGEIAIGACLQEKHIAVFVRDTGRGIDPELLPRVFDRYVAGGESTGLGLAISREIILEHRGTIQIKSEVNRGTEISFTLPIESEKEKEENHVHHTVSGRQ